MLSQRGRAASPAVGNPIARHTGVVVEHLVGIDAIVIRLCRAVMLQNGRFRDDGGERHRTAISDTFMENGRWFVTECLAAYNC